MNANTFGTDYRYGIASIDMAPPFKLTSIGGTIGGTMDTGNGVSILGICGLTGNYNF